MTGLHAVPSGGSALDDASITVTAAVWGFDQWVQRNCVVPAGLYPQGCRADCNATAAQLGVCKACKYPAACVPTKQKYDVVKARNYARTGGSPDSAGDIW